MPGNDLDASPGFSFDSDAARTDGVQDVPWSALALSGMGLIAISLVAFVMVTEESANPPRTIVALDPIVARRITVPDLAPAPSQTSVVARSDDATAIARTIRTAAAVAPQQSGSTIAARAFDESHRGLAPAPDPRLIAPGPHGALPRIGRDGARPSDIYARPVKAGARFAAGAPRIAIVVSGLGSDLMAGERAIEQLPAAITFAFTSTGDHVDEQTEQARAAGHELLLQTPMEGAGGARAPGPRTLAADAPRDRTIDALHWHMSRFSGYIGLMNQYGARFMAAPQPFSALIQDVAERGLVFLDDGASAQSLTASLAAAAGAQAARADVTLDPASKPETMDLALRRLETLARERGAAIGVSPASLQSVDRIRSFAQGLEARGVALVPVSALIEAPARTSAR